jgi:cytochrome b6-f complex iron-sulfur subunit
MTDTPTPNEMPRRSFLDLLLGVGVLGTAGSALFPVFKYLKPLPLEAAGGPLRLSERDSAILEREQFVIVSSGSKRAIVFQDASSQLRALSAKCTHEGCTVQYVAGESIIWCACHNGRFDIDGRVLSGPPPKALAEYAVQTGDDGGIIVNLETA